MAGFDMHMHSTASDGALSPAELVEAAAARDLLGLSLTDHDSVGGNAAAAARAAELDIAFIPGVELSAEVNERDVHILGYWLDSDKLLATGRLQHLSAARRQRGVEIVRRLSLLGMELDMDAILANCGGSLGRPHIAQAMVEAGYVANIREAFGKWLSRGMPAYVPREKLTPLDAVQLILAAGGVPVIAHPGTGVPDAMIPMLAREGLGGVEVYHPEHNAAAEQKYSRMARNLRLAQTGGSDFHVQGLREIGCRITTVGQLEILARYKPNQAPDSCI